MSNALFQVPVAVNEPVRPYVPGTSEHKNLISKYKEMFFDLTKRSFVDTGNFDCVQIILTYDSKHCVVLLTEDDTKWHI